MQPNPISKQHNSLRIGIDIGGTFTDFVVFDPANGEIKAFQAAIHAA